MQDRRQIIRDGIDTAMGLAPADMMVINGRIANVYTGEILDGQVILVKSGRIAHVGAPVDGAEGPDTHVINAGGKTVIPGFIDGHTHLAWLFHPARFLEYALADGATTFITETMETYPVAGYDGVMDFLAALRDQPARFYATAPAMASISASARGVPTDELERLMALPEIIGMGETYWQALFQDTDQVLARFETVRAAGKRLEGHSAGARGAKLSAYAGAGISSCHEPITAEEALERLRLGMCVMIREGSIRRDLSAMAPLAEAGIDTRLLTLATDGVEPGDLMRDGYMAPVVRKAIAIGFDPMTAVRMATLNVAAHFGLDGEIGGIAPGRLADLVMVPDIADIRPETVIVGGRVVADRGKVLAAPRMHAFSAASLGTVRLPAALTAADFAIPVPPEKIKNGRVRARAIRMITDLVTREQILELPVTDGMIGADPAGDVIKVAAVERRAGRGERFVGLINGFGLKAGAVGTSAAWDTADIVVAGADDADMAAVVNRIAQLQGGVVVCRDGKVVAEMPLPIMGLMNDAPLPELVEMNNRIRMALKQMGMGFHDPALTLNTLTGAAIPFIRICEAGLVELRDGKTRGLFDIGEDV